MKKILFFLIPTLMVNLIFGQTENYRKAFEEFEKEYNSNNFENVFSSFSSEMQQALPLNQTNKFFKNLKNEVGNIESGEFIEFQQGTFASYKTKFQKATLSVNISIDAKQKINGFSINPYKEKTNHVVNALTNIPQNWSDSIYNQVRNFPDNTQLSIAIIENGKATFYGLLKQNDSLKSIDNKDKVFEIGSITKVFTSTVLAVLVTGKKLSLDDSINSFYKFSFKENVQLQFKSLANHTSGLPRLPSNLDVTNKNNPYKNYGSKELEQYLMNGIALEHKPNETYSYSNLGAGLLGYTLGLSQKTTFQNLLQTKVFDKYKMSDSYVSKINLNDRLVKGRDENGKETPNWDFDVLFGGGGILSTVNDLSKFAIAQFNPGNKDLALTRTPTFTINEKMKTGLGWHIITTEYGKELYWHNGGTGGYSSSMTLDMENKNGLVILSNVSAFHSNMQNIDNLCFSLMKNISNK